MEDTMATEDKKTAAPYTAWTTLKNVLDGFSRHMPNRIDKSVFQNQSGSVQAQLILSLRFLQFIEEDGKPTDALLKFAAAKDESEKKALLSAQLRTTYPDLFALDLMKTTPDQFAAKITGSYGVTGETRDKATRFFLAGAKYAGITVSPLLEKKAAANGSGRKRRPAAKRKPQSEPKHAAAVSGGATSKTVELESGGSVTLAAAVDLFGISETDRDFVFSLVKKLDEYERNRTVAPAEEEAPEEEGAPEEAPEGEGL
jgi:hypothetical protein